MNKLDSRPDGKYFTSVKTFAPLGTFKNSTIEKAFKFAYDMTFGADGEHRAYRSGGTHVRKNGEIFADTFQGKLAEFAIYNQLFQTHKINVPDLGVWNLGEWDDVDFIIDGKKTAVKSTKSFGQLLLLEKKDWSADGAYIPNLAKNGGLYDYFILVRMNPFCADLLKQLKYYYSDKAPYSELEKLLTNEQWQYDIPGYITRSELAEVIQQGNIIFQGEKLNGKMPMDADNYYVQAADMHPISEI